ncbi:hypothetical protein PNEG_02020 [Pneumocystis murina B123]|uniref:Geranylgeranyl transferase type-2 subunit alpha n=1 Tax=Pneumocystis murina (strain B123) TaxID=1069680 RepID=M7PHB6_PNEMU|nr:hypothetical protein PNEG_02020 [Pneumocystis murina B123]EMR09839.1 hypothetical protein PNEG_02020 [Pneumocystis murina B123]
MNKNTSKKKTHKEIESLLKDIQKHFKNNNYNYEILTLTTEFLKESYENYTIWNYRRDILKNGVLLHTEYDKTIIQNIISKELQFLNELIKKYPKIYNIWSHRKWCFENAPFPIWEQEKAFLDLILTKDSKNFHAWNYRQYIIPMLEKQNKTSYVKNELDYTTSVLKDNFSNFSAFHYRTTLIPRFINESSYDYLERKHFFDQELFLTKSIIYTSPDNCSIWTYHNWLLNSISKLNDSLLSDDVTVKLNYINQEIKMIEDLMELEPNRKYLMNAYINYNILLSKTSKNLLNIPKKKIIETATKLKEIDFLRKGRYDDLILSLEKL